MALFQGERAKCYVCISSVEFTPPGPAPGQEEAAGGHGLPCWRLCQSPHMQYLEPFLGTNVKHDDSSPVLQVRNAGELGWPGLWPSVSRLQQARPQEPHQQSFQEAARVELSSDQLGMELPHWNSWLQKESQLLPGGTKSPATTAGSHLAWAWRPASAFPGLPALSPHSWMELCSLQQCGQLRAGTGVSFPPPQPWSTWIQQRMCSHHGCP